ncbi:hypothetical protein [Streptomyces sp. CS113]|uniref:hypothetical protein n=1 Tax=Streptomyces sp. CS113 TaxID=1982761 RepID=UPI0015C5A635|nr:hypothetical protein [Streptomyces sp. CS113]
MTFYRVHFDRGRNAYWAMEEESEELYETAQTLLDPETGSFTDEVSEQLEYAGSCGGRAWEAAVSAAYLAGAKALK